MNYDPRLVIEKNAFFQLGEERGSTQGITQRIIKGAYENSREIAVKLKENGMPDDKIASITALPLGVIKELTHTITPKLK
ncbi:hypothetical protein ACSBL2_24935 [Pedobacter sp. AW31-3R]|uniref:hypothetical protein n=1 Tax=Pedobacter sp. AW31-3R TaxID=3445781 RepID=UPI003FA16130